MTVLQFWTCKPTPTVIMASPLVLGLGMVTAFFGGRAAYRFLIRGGAGAAQRFVQGGFKPKMDEGEALQVLGLK